MAEIETIKMRRPFEGVGPNTADVHPAEVNNWLAAGWVIAEDAPAIEPPAVEELGAEEATVITVNEAAERAAKPKRGRKPKGK